MNIAVINLKDILKYVFYSIIVLIILVACVKLITIIYNTATLIIEHLGIQSNNNSINIGLLKASASTVFLDNTNQNINKNGLKDLLFLETGFKTQVKEEVVVANANTDNNTEATQVVQEEKKEKEIISKTANTEAVKEKNITPVHTNNYGKVKINNTSDYSLTEEMIKPDINFTNKQDILIFHTHTCESYTPSEKYNYEMTGNYRTTDSNYNVVRVGKELTDCLNQKGFNVIHDETYHDYPSYSGSYTRSLETVNGLLSSSEAEIVIDLHRDAVGSSNEYAPRIKVDGNYAAQLMFVIGTDGGGLEHPNWNNNLKMAVAIQEKAEEMYPGLFRPIILRNSRYNQHVANGACIIEVGATGNTLEECILSMQCLSNVLEETFK